MAARKSKCEPLIRVEYQEGAVANGRQLLPGTEVSIRKERGRFRFVNSSITNAGKTVLHFIGGPSGHEVFRSFYPERIKRVHRINRTRVNITNEEGK